MRVSNGQIWQAGPALAELLQEDWIPVKPHYWLSKLARKVGEHLRDIEAVRITLFQRYGETAEDGKQIQVRKDSEHWAAFEDAHNELMDEQVELDVNVIKIALPDDDGKPCKHCGHKRHMDGGKLLALEPFVEIVE